MVRMVCNKFRLAGYISLSFGLSSTPSLPCPQLNLQHTSWLKSWRHNASTRSAEKMTASDVELRDGINQTGSPLSLNMGAPPTPDYLSGAHLHGRPSAFCPCTMPPPLMCAGMQEISRDSGAFQASGDSLVSALARPRAFRIDGVIKTQSKNAADSAVCHRCHTWLWRQLKFTFRETPFVITCRSPTNLTDNRAHIRPPFDRSWAKKDNEMHHRAP